MAYHFNREPKNGRRTHRTRQPKKCLRSSLATNDAPAVRKGGHGSWEEDPSRIASVQAAMQIMCASAVAFYDHGSGESLVGPGAGKAALAALLKNRAAASVSIPPSTPQRAESLARIPNGKLNGAQRTKKKDRPSEAKHRKWKERHDAGDSYGRIAMDEGVKRDTVIKGIKRL